MHVQQDFVEQLLEQPNAVQQFQKIKTALELEQQRRLEFYEWVTEDIKAEFINGQIVIHSPVKKRHWNVTDLLSRLASIFVSVKKLGRIGIEKVMISLTRNDYEPDLCFFPKEKSDLFTDDQVLFPSPDFVVEILSKKTAAADRGIKKADYAQHGIKEYWIVDPVRRRVEQYILPTGGAEYFPAKIHQEGDLIEAVGIPGFSVPVLALFDETANVEAIAEFLKS